MSKVNLQPICFAKNVCFLSSGFLFFLLVFYSGLSFAEENIETISNECSIEKRQRLEEILELQKKWFGVMDYLEKEGQESVGYEYYDMAETQDPRTGEKMMVEQRRPIIEPRHLKAIPTKFLVKRLLTEEEFAKFKFIGKDTIKKRCQNIILMFHPDKLSMVLDCCTPTSTSSISEFKENYHNTYRAIMTLREELFARIDIIDEQFVTYDKSTDTIYLNINDSDRLSYYFRR